MKKKEIDPMGEKLKELRINKDWTQKKLASESGVSQPVISAYENGTRTRNEKTLKPILNALGVEYSTFFSNLNTEKRLDDLENAVFKKRDTT